MPQIPSGQIVAHVAQYHVDLEPLQQDGKHLVWVEGSPQGQHTGKEKGQAQDVQDLPPAGRSGEPLEQGVDQIEPDEGVQDPQVEVGIPWAADTRADQAPPSVSAPPPSRWDTTAYMAPQNTSMQKAGRTRVRRFRPGPADRLPPRRTSPTP